MITIIQNEKYYTIPYNPTQTLSDLKTQISKITSIPLKSLTLLFNNIPLTNDTSIISLLIPDNVTLHTAILSPQQNTTNMNLNNNKDLESLSKMFPQLQTELTKNKSLNEFVKTGALQDEFNKMSKNPKYVESQMRSMDLAMSKLENMFGGFNMMKSMMKDVNEPLSKIFMNDDKKINVGQQINNVNLKQVGDEKKNLKLTYAVQLRELMEMGYKDMQKNLYYLDRSNGDVYEAILLLTEENESSNQSW